MHRRAGQPAPRGWKDQNMSPPRGADRSLEALMDQAWDRSRLSVRARWERVRSKAWHVGQCAVAAALAWFIANNLAGHPAPVFAPIVAVVCLGMTYGQRLRRVAEVTVGVAVGLAVADLFLSVFGSGPWQVGLIVLVAMSAALFLDTGVLLTMQAAVQSIFVVALVATPHAAVTRWLDAVIGGAVALVAAAVVPQAPLRRPRIRAGVVVTKIAGLLRDAAQCARDGDVERAAEVLATARATDGLIGELRAAADEGLSVLASSPLRRAHTENVRSVADLVEPLDRAMRSTRVLVRRVAVTANRQVRVPRSYAVVLDELADATDVVGRALAENAHPQIGRSGLVRVGESTRALERSHLLTDVLLIEIRSLIVDLLRLTGLDDEQALAALPGLPEPPTQS
jgi:uncharacterized membrane protein YgaE (UPF0421/DUF939 family)